MLKGICYVGVVKFINTLIYIFTYLLYLRSNLAYLNVLVAC